VRITPIWCRSPRAHHRSNPSACGPSKISQPLANLVDPAGQPSHQQVRGIAFHHRGELGCCVTDDARQRTEPAMVEIGDVRVEQPVGHPDSLA
jgi:hypothetical protein